MIFNTSGGGGAGLNFKIIGGTTQPTNPSENTIWINTDREVIGWTLKPNQPDVKSGYVWIMIANNSAISFNALKKNHLYIYPINAYYSDGTSWEIKPAQIYQGGKWYSLTEPLVIVPNISNYPESAWIKVGNAGISVTSTNTKVTYSDSDNNDPNMRYLDIDVTNYTTMEFIGTATAKASGTGTSSVNLRAGLFNGTTFITGYSAALKNGVVDTINSSYDISNVTGVCRFGFLIQVASTSGYTANFDMTSMVLR